MKLAGNFPLKKNVPVDDTPQHKPADSNIKEAQNMMERANATVDKFQDRKYGRVFGRQEHIDSAWD